MDKEKLMDLVNTDFNKFQLEIKRFYKEEYVVSLEQQCKKQKEVINNAIEYIKEKQKIQYKFALSHIECDDLLEILENKEASK